MLKIFNYPIQKVTLFFEYIGQYLVLMSRVFRSFESWPDYFSNTIDQMIIIGSNSILSFAKSCPSFCT